MEILVSELKWKLCKLIKMRESINYMIFDHTAQRSYDNRGKLTIFLSTPTLQSGCMMPYFQYAPPSVRKFQL